MLKAKALEAMLYECATWSLRAWHNDTLRRAYHSFLTHCISRKNNRTDHLISYLDALMKAGSGRIEAIIRRRRILFAGFDVPTENTRLPKCLMFGELMRGCLVDDLRAFGNNANQWTTAAQYEGE